MGDPLLVCATNDLWKQKRKACSHAFYKERMTMMLETLKDLCMEMVEKITDEIESSAESVSVHNVGALFEQLFSRNIITVSFGEDITDIPIPYKVLNDDGSITTEHISISAYISRVGYESVPVFFDSLKGSMWNKLFRKTHKIYHVTPRGQIYEENCRTLRAFIFDYVQKRKRGEVTSKVAGQTDILSLMLANQQVFTDEVIVDEMADFFAAATETTQYTTQTIVSYLEKCPASLARIRAEFDSVFETACEEEPALKGLPRREMMRRFLSVDNLNDMDFLNRVICEALRWQAPVGGSSNFLAQADIQLGKYKLLKGDGAQVMIYGLHFNSTQWQRPHEFLPERFDPKSPLFLTPAGKKRHPMSFVPFSGGSRVCFGKTFAEANLRIVTTYLSQHFEISHQEKARYAEAYPIAQVFMSYKRPVPMEFRKRAI